MPVISNETRTLFFTTSPRTPAKMIPEVLLLADCFDGESWDSTTQSKFMSELVKRDFYSGAGSPSDGALSARDRINRAPKALGLIDLKPTVSITPAGEEYMLGSRSDEALLRQLLKFQLPSPFHKLSRDSDQAFFVKPYLEIIRLVRHFGSLAFDELMLFGLQLTEFSKFDAVVLKIEEFRRSKALNKGKYKAFFAKYCEEEIREIYAAEIGSGKTTVRESSERTVANFIRTKKSNMRDYADACFRYLRATEIVAISQSGHSLSIPQDRLDDVDFLLRTVSREPVFVDNEAEYKAYLFDATLPVLFSDDITMLRQKIAAHDPNLDTSSLTIARLKDIEAVLRAHRKAEKLGAQVARIKNLEVYDEIEQVFEGIIAGAYYDNPLMLEWNVWRSMTMLDGGAIEGNFKMDDDGLPISTAAGNMSDIVCDYGSFIVLVEVTLQSGQRQYDNEAEPVARHLGKMKALAQKPTFCLFVAPTINPATIAHFYMLHLTAVSHYGGKAVIVPIELSVFRKMLRDSYQATYTPEPSNIEALFKRSQSIARSATDENDWYKQMTLCALDWLRTA